MLRTIVRQREEALTTYVQLRGIATLWAGNPIGRSFGWAARRARVRLYLWDRALDLVTLNGRI